ncbi:MAG: prolyl oligopeptidase family serine peptidase [Gammaproteobacteria bacterium]|nr:prolyl oligopeptidase family serine peptidase [Gammaproteobacteria bacterium]
MTSGQQVSFNVPVRDSYLAAILDLPTSSAIDKEYPVVITCHGFTSGKNGPSWLKISDCLTKRGIACVRFDFSGHYDSPGNVGDLTFAQGTEDLKAVVDHLDQFNQIDRTKIGLYGSSYATPITFRYIAEFNNVIVLALKAPRIDLCKAYRDRLGEKAIQAWRDTGVHVREKGDDSIKMSYEIYADAERHDIYETAKHIDIPTYIAHGTADQSCPFDQTEKLADIMGDNLTLDVFEGGDHGFTRPGDHNKVTSRSASFLAKYLLSDNNQ